MQNKVSLSTAFQFDEATATIKESNCIRNKTQAKPKVSSAILTLKVKVCTLNKSPRQVKLEKFDKQLKNNNFIEYSARGLWRERKKG